MTVEIEGQPALLVVDLQAGTLASAFAHPADDVLSATASLVDAFRGRRAPVVFATSTGTPPGRNAYGSQQRLFPEEARAIAPALGARDDEPVVARAALSAFSGTDLDAMLRDRGVATVVVAGVATSFGVESSVRAAYDLRFHVVVASDAVTDLRRETHDHALRAVFPAIAQVAATAEIVGLLDRA